MSKQRKECPINLKGWLKCKKCGIHRSSLECLVEKELNEKGVSYAFEGDKIPYSIPETLHIYNPDFTVQKGFLECKSYDKYAGLHLLPVRKKYLYIKESNPFMRLIFIFDKKEMMVTKSMTAERWCDKNGFEYRYLGELTKQDLE